jgi:hypothetical protein
LQRTAASLLYKLSSACPEALSFGAIARMAEHVLDGRTRADDADRELAEVKQGMILFNATAALVNCMGSLTTEIRAFMTMTNKGIEGQQFPQARAMEVALRTLQYFGAWRLTCLVRVACSARACHGDSFAARLSPCLQVVDMF